ncbi:unnamed protein product [Amoebophrya sp. A25]|nr:unnamed protein product [Amoebophrya sp. A25]|eukprot:GSA25T00018836001.1
MTAQGLWALRVLVRDLRFACGDGRTHFTDTLRLESRDGGSLYAQVRQAFRLSRHAWLFVPTRFHSHERHARRFFLRNYDHASTTCGSSNYTGSASGASAFNTGAAGGRTGHHVSGASDRTTGGSHLLGGGSADVLMDLGVLLRPHDLLQLDPQSSQILSSPAAFLQPNASLASVASQLSTAVNIQLDEQVFAISRADVRTVLLHPISSSSSSTVLGRGRGAPSTKHPEVSLQQPITLDGDVPQPITPGAAVSNATFIPSASPTDSPMMMAATMNHAKVTTSPPPNGIGGTGAGNINTSSKVIIPRLVYALYASEMAMLIEHVMFPALLAFGQSAGGDDFADEQREEAARKEAAMLEDSDESGGDAPLLFDGKNKGTNRNRVSQESHASSTVVLSNAARAVYIARRHLTVWKCLARKHVAAGPGGTSSQPGGLFSDRDLVDAKEYLHYGL